MRRYELWIDNDNRLVISEYSSVKSDFERNILRGSDTYNLIQLLNTKPILNIIEKEKEDKIVLEFENYVININDLSQVVGKRGIGPIIKNIEKYSKSKVVKEVKKKKVVRKNKHTGKKIIATGLALVIVAGALYLFNAHTNAMSNDVQNIFEKFSISDIDNSSEVYDNMSTMEEVNISNLIVNNDNKINTIEYENVQKVSINYGDRSDTDKAYKTRAYYGDMIEKYAKMYGMDPNLVIGIATQERGVHGTTIDEGGAIGLMQIQYNVWNNDRISAYNFETGKEESFIIEGSRLSDIEYNIKVGCMYLQNCMGYMNNNVVAAVQCYNMGYGSMQKILKAYALGTGKSVQDILNNQADNGWLNYRDIINMGDQKYVEHVFSWMGEDFDIQTKTNDGSIINLNINNQTSKKIY